MHAVNSIIFQLFPSPTPTFLIRKLIILLHWWLNCRGPLTGVCFSAMLMFDNGYGTLPESLECKHVINTKPVQ
jgi:hypothetical protein